MSGALDHRQHGDDGIPDAQVGAQRTDEDNRHAIRPSILGGVKNNVPGSDCLHRGKAFGFRGWMVG